MTERLPVHPPACLPDNCSPESRPDRSPERWYDETLYCGLVDTSRPLRVVHVAKYFPPDRGGMETYVRDLAFEQAAAGHEVTVLAHSRAACERETPMERCEVLRCKTLVQAGSYVPVAPGIAWSLWQALRQRSPKAFRQGPKGVSQIVHLHAPNPAAFWCLALPWPQKTALVVHWHADVIFPEHKGPSAPVLALWRAMERKLLARADRIIATSAPYLASSAFLAPWRSKCVVAPLRLSERGRTAAPDVNHPAAKFLREPVSGTSRSVLAVGRLAHYKGFDVLLRAVAEAPALRCCLIGEGEEGPALQKLAHDLGIADRVLFAGEVDDNALTACYGACDVFCLPSILRTEAFGLVLLEALRAGKWCVASDVPGSGMGTVIRHGENGWLVKPGDVNSLAQQLVFSINPGERRLVA